MYRSTTPLHPLPIRARSGPGHTATTVSVSVWNPFEGKELDDDVHRHRPSSAAHRQVVAVITMIIAGLGFLLLVAIVVGIVDAMQAASWRQVAAERREQWESRHLQPHGRVRIDNDD